jgi:hypothetical protein
MCDCYEHKCKICNNEVPIHIGDFAFPREDVEVWCHQHLPIEVPGVEIFQYPTCAIRLCGGRLRPWDECVHPNTSTGESIAWTAMREEKDA